MRQNNPKIIHRIYFPEFRPFHDPFEHYLETWRREMPDYDIKIWNSSNLDVHANEWTRQAFEAKSPVFLAEYFRWKVLEQFGGLYLDADCEVLDGKILSGLIDDLYAQDEYDTFFGVEEKSNGHPTAQTVAAKKGSDLVRFMKEMYEKRLSGPLWHWRERRGLIGPQLMALYFLERNINLEDDGFFKNLDVPVVAEQCKVYPQTYFSPKFTILGETIDVQEGQTCVYHMFANSNVDYSRKPRQEAARTRPLTFSEYRKALAKASAFPRLYEGSRLETRIGSYQDHAIVSDGKDGVLSYGPYISLRQGRYVASFNCRITSAKGAIDVHVTANSGADNLGHRSIQVSPSVDGKIVVPFVVKHDVAEKIEFVVSSIGVEHIALDSVGVDFEDAYVAQPRAAKTGSLKILHRIYFGFDGKPDPFQGYLNTWQEQLPEFEIMHWNASNLPMDANDYVRRLYVEQDHAFLSDYFRWYVLRQFGGIYLDADVEVVDGTIFRNLVAELETAADFDAFIGIDQAEGGWYTAHSMASKPNSDLSVFLCNVYENFGSFTAWRKKGLYFWAPQLVGLYFADKKHNVNGMGTSPHLTAPTVEARVKIYPQDWFSPISPSGEAGNPFKIDGLSDNTCLCHHFACSWHDDNSIYVEHSKQRGGQSGALLRDLVEEAGPQTFSARSSLLSTIVGERRGDRFVTTHRAGYLVFGPYVSLLAGRYRISVGFADVEEWGRISIDMAQDNGKVKLLDREVMKADLREGRIELDLQLTALCTDFECRVLVDATTTLALTDLTIERSTARA